MIASRLGLAAVALLVSLPFLIPEHTSPIPSFHEEWAAAILGLAACSSLLDARRLPLPGATLLALSLGAIAIAQMQMGPAPVPQLTFLFALYLVWAALLSSASRHLAQTFGAVRLVRVLAGAVLAGSLLAAMCSLIGPRFLAAAWMGLPPQMGGALAQPNHFSSYLWIGLASALYLRSTSKLSAPACWFAFSVLTLTATLAGQRSSLIYAAALIAFNLWPTAQGASGSAAESRRLSLGIGLLFLLMQGLATLFSNSAGGLAKPPPGLRAVTELEAAPVRFQLWRVGMEGILAAPLVGNGVGSYPGMALTYADRLDSSTNPGPSEHAHNVLVDLAAELGLPAAFLLTLGAGIWLRRLPQSAARPEARWAATVVAVLALHSLFEYPLWYAYFLGLVAVVTGALGPPRAIGSRLAPVALSIGLLAWGSLILSQLRSDYAQIELAYASSRRPTTMARAGEGLLRIPATSLLAPWVATTLCISLDPLRVPVVDGQSVCRIGMAFAPTIDCAVNAAVVRWRAGDSAGASDLIRRLKMATRQFGADRVDALVAPLIAREPQLKTLLAASE